MISPKPVGIRKVVALRHFTRFVHLGCSGRFLRFDFHRFGRVGSIRSHVSFVLLRFIGSSGFVIRLEIGAVFYRESGHHRDYKSPEEGNYMKLHLRRHWSKKIGYLKKKCLFEKKKKTNLATESGLP